MANVVEAVNIRAAASEDSTIVGYLTTAASADVIERGETWSLVISGGVEGYVRNDCLAFGEDAKNLAGVYGSEGVKTYWDGVSLLQRRTVLLRFCRLCQQEKSMRFSAMTAPG